MKQFTEKFDAYIVVGDTITLDLGPDDFTVEARIVFDDITTIDDDDTHNTDQSVTGCTDEQFQKLLAARQAWKDDEWFYCGVVLSVSIHGISLTDHGASLWGIECNYPDSDNNYLTDIANDLLSEAIAAANDQLSRFSCPACGQSE